MMVVDFTIIVLFGNIIQVIFHCVQEMRTVPRICQGSNVVIVASLLEGAGLVCGVSEG
jgi:hypothetical protein